MNLIKPIYFAFFIVAFVAYNSFISVDIGSAEESTEDRAGTTAELKAAEIEEKLNRTVESIELIQAVQSQQVAAEFGISMTEIEKRLLNLGKLKTSYQRLRTSITDLKKLEKDRLSIKQRYEDYHAKGMAKRPPYTLTFLDAVFEELSAAERQQQNIQLTMEMLRQEIVEHNEGLKNAEKELRKSQERLEAAAESKKKMLRWEVDENNVQKEYLQAIIQAKNNEIQRYQLEKDLTALQIALLKEQTAFIGANVAYAEEDLKQRLETLQQQRAEIQSENEQLRQEQEDIEEKWLKAQRDVEKQQTGDQRAIAAAYLEAREEWRKTYQIALELNEKAMLLMDRQIMAWKNRYALVKGDLAVDRLKEMKEEIETGVNGIGQILKIQQNYLINR
jgi:hypothetical protein